MRTKKLPLESDCFVQRWNTHSGYFYSNDSICSNHSSWVIYFGLGYQLKDYHC